MKHFLILSLILIGLNSFSQTFTDIDAGLTSVENSSVAWGDYDNDGDLDLIICGDSASVSLAKIYRNDSILGFVDIGANIDGVSSSSVDWGDYDNDGDLDLALCGYSSEEGYITKIYQNILDSCFEEQTSINLVGVSNGVINWGDYDNDGDLDILLTGYSDSYESRIYRNDGNDVFTDINADLTGVRYSSVMWGDYDNDGDLDILLSGYNGSSGVLKIYRNEGGDVFTDIYADIKEVYNGYVSWADYDNDGDLDILRVGYYQNDEYDYFRVAKVFRNDGEEIFTDINAELTGVSSCSAAWGDYDNDGNVDILISGYNGSCGISKIYKNNANNTFTEQTDILLDSIYYSSVDFGDYDNDGDLDFFLAGVDISGVKVAKIYKNNTSEINTPPTKPTGLVAATNGNITSLKWNQSNDDHTSLKGLSYNLFIGKDSICENTKPSMSDISSGYRKITKFGDIVDTTWFIHQLDTGKYYWAVQAIDNSFLGSEFSEVDSFEITFANSISPTQKQVISLLTNGDTLTVHETGIPDSRQWKYSLEPGGPYTNILTGETDTIYIPNFDDFGTYYVVCESVKDEVFISNEVVIQIMVFQEVNELGLAKISAGDVDWGDYDNDGDLDILLTGYDTNYENISKIYRNTLPDSIGFSEQTSISLSGVQNSSVAWGDYDNDGDLDILLTGYDTNYDPISKIYRNTLPDSVGFSEQTNITLTGVRNSSVAWGDYDNDGDLDILLTGNVSYSESISKIYRNTLPNSDGFSEQTNITLTGVQSGSVAWGDYDNDGDLDILLTGYDNNDESISKIYRNDGENIFVDINALLIGIRSGTAIWGDYDMDGDLDILLTGSNSSKIYRNDGDNIFTDINADITGVSLSSSSWGDYDNDGDLDILLTGSASSKIYRNDENNLFTDINTNVTGVHGGSVAWGDYDNDGDLDILLTGNSSSGRISTIYRNNCIASNTLPTAPISIVATEDSIADITLQWSPANDAQTSSKGLTYNIRVGKSTDASDIINPQSDINGKRKIVAMGNAQTDTLKVLKKLKIGKYYWSVQAIDNNFAGGAFSQIDSFNITNFFQASSLSVIETSGSETYIQWLPGNGDSSIVFMKETGGNAALPANNTSYIANNNMYSGSQAEPGWYCVYNGSANSTHVKELKPFTTYIWQVFTYIGETGFEIYDTTILNNTDTTQTAFPLPGVMGGSVAWGDYDNDGDLDILLTGSGISNSKIYRNTLPDSVGFVESGISFPGVYSSSVAWGDYDKDGDLDILLTGESTSPISKIYKNTLPDSVGFLEQTDIELTGVSNSSVAWGDYDSDGDLDIILTGSDTNYVPISKIYRNNYPTNSFTVTQFSLPKISGGSVAWADYDNDSDLDILLSGYSGGMAISNIYRNDLATSGVFSEISLPGAGVSNNSVAWGDYDNDGDLDILISGYGISNSKIYKNTLPDSVGFSEQTDIELPGVRYSSVAWGDYDNDGNLDILITGNRGGYPNYNPISKIYHNNFPLNSFTEQTGIPLIGVGEGSSAFGDFDNDGDLDILLTGNSSNNVVSLVYLNKTKTTNTTPAAPDNISHSILSGEKVQFTWSPSSDDHTPTKTLTYNISLGTTLGDNDIISAEALEVDGKLLKPSPGNNGFDTSYTTELLPGTYYFAVQSVDQSYKASAFSTKEIVIDQVQASGLKGTATQNTTMLLQWLRGNGSRCAVFMKCLSAIDTAKPVANTKYLGVDIFGDGDMIGNTDWYCIYNGTSESVEVRGLKTGVDYIVQVMEYTENGTSIVYNNSIESNLGSFSLLPFSEQTGNSLANVGYSSASWADYDNDGDLDILLTGYHTGTGTISKIYCNNGDNSFSELIGIPLVEVMDGSSAWGDYDNDGDLDIIITGSGYGGLSGIFTKIYRNTLPDSVGFIEQTNIALTGVQNSSVAWGDYDNDGDLDILLAGNGDYNDYYNRISKIYRNTLPDSLGFLEQTDIVLEGVRDGSAAWGDYDNDGDLDILLTGFGVSKIYRNTLPDSLGFIEQTDIVLPPLSYSSVAWGDYDKDGDLDILLAGSSSSKIYRNNYPINSFSEQVNISLIDVGVTYMTSATWCDYDNDGDLDILLTGNDNSYERISKIYRNNFPLNSFTDTQISLPDVSGGALAWGDYDNDGDSDILLTGFSSSGAVSKIYRNNIVMKSGIYANAKATKPTGLKSEKTQKGVKLSWVGPSNDETHQSTLSYNINIYTNKDSLLLKEQYSCDTIRKPEMGNCGINNFYYPNCPPSNNYYYYRVQAVDQGFLGGEWSAVDSFKVNNLQPYFTANTVCFGDSTTFLDESNVSGTEIEHWHWDFGDDSTSTDSCPKHIYADTGQYIVTLSITDTAGVSSEPKTDTVLVLSTPKADFTADHVCFPAPIVFKNNTNTFGKKNTSYIWKINEANYTTDSVPGDYGAIAGSYNIELIATGKNTCSDTATKIVQVVEKPTANILYEEARDLCPGDTLILHAGENNIPDYTYRWYRGEIPMDTSTYLIEATLEANYSVAIENTIAHCVDSSSAISVTVYNPIAAPAIQIIGNPVSCEGEPVILYVDYPSTYNYQWYSSVGGVGADSSRYSVVNTESYYAKITYEGKCEQLSADTVDIAFDPLPTIPPITQSGNSCDSVKLSVRNNDDYKYQWLQDGIFIENATDTSYYVTDIGSKTYSLRIVDITGIGCSNESEGIPINILQKPYKPIIEVIGSLEFCDGDTTILKINSQELDAYWAFNSELFAENVDSVFAVEEGTYTAWLENENGCTSDAEVDITVNPAPTPVAISLDGSLSFCEDESVTLSVNSEAGFNYQWFENEIAITGAITTDFIADETGSYYVYISNETDCDYSTPAIEVTSSEYPTQQSIVTEGDTLICPGEDVIFNVVENPYYTYKWKHDGVQVPNATSFQYIATEEGKYTVDIDNSGCGITTEPREVVYKPAPPKPELLAQGPNVWILACSNDSAQNYRWFYNGDLIPGETEYMYLANQNLGDYNVTINDGGECYISSDIVTIPLGATGIDETGPFGEIKIYPNPTPGVFNIEMNNQIIGKIYIRITNLNGKELFNLNFQKHTRQFHTQMDLSGQGKGIYLIEFRFEKDVAVRKLVVE